MKTTTIAKLGEQFDQLMLGWQGYGSKNNKKAKGFTIGKGKKLYWYLLPVATKKFVGYRCFPVEGSTLGWPRLCSPEQEVTIHYE